MPGIQRHIFKINFTENNFIAKRFTILTLIILYDGGSAVAQQYDWNKESQKQREKENAAYIEAMKPEKKKKADNSSGTGSDNYYDNLAAADRQKREDAMSAEYKANYLKKVAHFEKMSSHVPKV